jgi:hypothetical protein
MMTILRESMSPYIIIINFIQTDPVTGWETSSQTRI